MSSLLRRILGAPAVVAILAVAVLPAGGCPATTAKRNPQLSRTHYLLGDDLLGKRQPEGAKRELLKAVELDPENREAQQLIGIIFFIEAMQKLNILEREQCLKGVAAEEQQREANKEFRRSDDYLQVAMQLGEKEGKAESDLLNYRANIALHFKRFDDAITLCKRALDNILYTQRQLSLATLGWAYFQKGDRVSAARELRQSIFHEPKFCVGRYRLAKVYYEDKDYDKAIGELKQVTEDKACPIQEAFQLLGLAYLKKRALEPARAQFDQCDKLNPKSCVSEECRRYAKLM